MMSILDSLSLGPCFAAHGISEIYPEEDESSPEYDTPKPLQTGPWARIEVISKKDIFHACMHLLIKVLYYFSRINT